MRQVTEADVIAIASAIAGDTGSYIDYSTTEKIVGTWIDGKPIYQKTWSGLTTQASSSAQGKELIDLSSLNVENVISIDGFLGIDVGYSVPINTYNDNDFHITTRWESNSSTSVIKQVSAGWYNRPEVVTVRYTKSTN